MGKNYLTKGLIVLQFVLAIFLIIGTIVINSQLRYLLHKNLGYDSSDLFRIDLPFDRATDKLPALFKNELANQSNIISVAARNRGRSISGAKANGKNIIMEYNRIDDRYLPTFKIPIIEGRNFSPEFGSDSSAMIPKL
jgi:hypothetical protein